MSVPKEKATPKKDYEAEKISSFHLKMLWRRITNVSLIQLFGRELKSKKAFGGRRLFLLQGYTRFDVSFFVSLVRKRSPAVSFENKITGSLVWAW